MSVHFQYNPEIDPWEQQNGEPQQQWHAFLLYRDGWPELKGTPRLQDVATKLGMSRQWAGLISNENAWVERRLAWNIEKDRIAREATIDAIKEMAKRHASVSEAAFVAVLRPLRALSKPRILMTAEGFPLCHKAAGPCPVCGLECQKPELDGKSVTIDRDTELEGIATAPLLLLLQKMATGLESLQRVEQTGRGQVPPAVTVSSVDEDPEGDAAMIHFADLFHALGQVGIQGELPAAEHSNGNGEIRVEPL